MTTSTTTKQTIIRVFNELVKQNKPKDEILSAIQAETGLSAISASTYYSIVRSGVWSS